MSRRWSPRRGLQWAFIFPYRLGSLLMTTLRSLTAGRLGYATAYARGLWNGVWGE